MAVIMFYTPFYRRSRDVESVMVALKKAGHTVIFLSQREAKETSLFLAPHGIAAHSHAIGHEGGIWWVFRHLVFFVRFCRTHRVDIVFSHLDAPNLVASVGQHFVPTKVFLCRHHIDEAELYGFHRSWSYRLTHFLARRIIVVSKKAMTYMIDREHVPPSKVIHINLAYDFSLYQPPDVKAVASIKAVTSGILLLTVCRLTKFKRPGFSLRLLQTLREKGVMASLVILGEGNERDSLLAYAQEAGLEKFLFLPGHVPNVVDYLAACDFVVHPSVLESSCVVIKEAGIMQKPVICCADVGDFSDYIHHRHNGFLVNKDNFVNEASELIVQYADDSAQLRQIGEALREDVQRYFSIHAVLPQYLALIG